MMVAVMQRHLRLHRQEDFHRLRATGRVWRHPFFILSVTSNNLPHNRYGFVTSKQLGSAVTRNRIRRRLREVMSRAHPFLLSGYDLALIARVPVAGQSYQAITVAVHGLLKQAGLWETER
ncbi:MAG: ribonuclease P protein component [Chloroflexi bacterium]|nr:MAG: ribonuclease P protein component [Chloroflexota bacterium]